jgi:hypothetical protein
MDQDAFVGAAGFEQADRHLRILAQPRGECAAGRAGADDDVIESLGGMVVSG